MLTHADVCRTYADGMKAVSARVLNRGVELYSVGFKIIHMFICMYVCMYV